MEVIQALEQRRSIRKFKSDPIPEGDVRALIRLATLAPSSRNQQMWRFIAVTNATVRTRMADTVRQAYQELMSWPETTEAQRADLCDTLELATHFCDAPVAIAVLLGPYESKTEKILIAHGMEPEEATSLRGYPTYQSIGMAVENLLLSAHAMGYGACPMTGPLLARHGLERLLRVEPPWRLAMIVALGLPDEFPQMPARKPLEEVLTFLR